MKRIIINISLFMLLAACANVKHQPKTALEARTILNPTSFIKQESDAFLTRGLSASQPYSIINQYVEDSPYDKTTRNQLLEKSHITRIELILALPNDALFDKLDQQTKFWQEGKYLTIEGNLENLDFLIPETKPKKEIDIRATQRNKEKIKDKHKKIKIES